MLSLATTARRAALSRSNVTMNGRAWPRRAFRSSAPSLAKIPFMLADIGEGIKECEVMEWFVRPGDEVKQFDKICEVQSDKATVEITSRFDGKILSLEWKQGDFAQVGAPLVFMDTEDEEALEGGTAGDPAAKGGSAEDSPVPPAQEEEEKQPDMERAPKILERSGSFSVDPVLRPTHAGAPEEAPPLPQSEDAVLATPAVRRLAREHDLELGTVQGSGPKGRVLKGDVLAYISNVPVAERKRHTSEFRQQRQQPGAQPKSPASLPAAQQQQQQKETATGDAAPAPSGDLVRARLLEDAVLPVRGIQRAMVKSMEASLRIPHFNFMEEYEMSRLAELRESLKPAAAARGLRLSYMPILIKATSLALVHFPGLNAHVNADASEVTHRAAHNIAVAMDTPRGLLVPVIRDAQRKSIFEIAADLAQLQQLAAASKLGERELSGATFTLSNIGTIGGTYAAPVIPAPTVVIGALGRIQTLPRFKNDKDPGAGVLAARIMRMSWAADHRIVDGATMARFSNQLKEYIEAPAAMIADLS